MADTYVQAARGQRYRRKSQACFSTPGILAIRGFRGEPIWELPILRMFSRPVFALAGIFRDALNSDFTRGLEALAGRGKRAASAT